MGLFRDVGRRVERFKQQIEEVAEEEASFRCTLCGEVFYTAHDTCPECGGSAVEEIDPPAEPEAAETDDDSEPDRESDG